MRHYIILFSFFLSANLLAQTHANIEQVRLLKFIKNQIASESFESVAVFDVDGDKQADIVSGSFWYKGPEFKVRYFIHDTKRYNTEYYDDFSAIPFDVNEDGRMDFITGGWWGNTIRWLENPGKISEWTEHVIATTGNVETTRGFDLDGDGIFEIIPNTPGQPLKVYKKEKGKPSFVSSELIDIHGHGLGFGDVNMDGRTDVIISSGWLEAPLNSGSLSQLHKEFDLGTASIPVIVADVNRDGLNDLIAGQAHDYGLYWYEQKLNKKDRVWIKHPIDPFNSQYHTMEWTDIDNDGQNELITGKRFRAHNEKDPGSFDPVGLYYFKWNGESFTKQVISFGDHGTGKGTGIYFSVFDVDGNQWKDIIVAGKDGLCIFYNQGF